ncbi:hypothetical protein [Microbacterium terrisoli]|jgi:hypothetical protein|uniref:hypothetical protein n=1 Tax=Microbacterium terrisoli TaxID=3242192 RepID=UPI00280613B1|nr:hypothetical protein [Microbacterium protaetiae]
MTALTTRPTATASLFGAPTRIERLLLALADSLETAARRRMQHRQHEAERIASGAADLATARREHIAAAYRGRFLR